MLYQTALVADVQPYGRLSPHKGGGENPFLRRTVMEVDRKENDKFVELGKGICGTYVGHYRISFSSIVMWRGRKLVSERRSILYCGM